MKIGLVCPYNMFRGGGVQEVVLHLAEGLEQRGHTVKIISPRPRGFDGEVPANFLLVGSSADVRTFSTTPSLSISVDLEEIEDILEHEEFDILHFHEPWIPVLSRQILGKSKHHCLNVATVHAKLPDTMAIKTLTSVVTPYVKSVIRHIDAFTAVSEAAAEYLYSVNGYHLDVQIIPNGIDLKKYRRPKEVSTDSSAPTILFIGRLEKRKGVKYLLSAFAELVERIPDARLLIAGDGPDRERLEMQAAELGIDSFTDFLGFVDEDAKLRLLTECSVFCSPALFGESFGIVLLEAMAMGAPIVAGDNPGYASVMKDRGRLSLVNPKDTTEFARRLELFMTDEAMRKLWLQWAKQYVKQFDYPNVVEQYVSLYEAALAKVA